MTAPLLDSGREAAFPRSDYIRFMIHPGTDPDCGIVVPAGALRVALRGPVRTVMARTPISSSPGNPSSLRLSLISSPPGNQPRPSGRIRGAHRSKGLPFLGADEISSPLGRRIVVHGKRSAGHIVFPRKLYRRLREGLSSSAGAHIVPSGKTYRRSWENISSPPGKFSGLPGKIWCFFACKSCIFVSGLRLAPCSCIVLVVIVCIGAREQ